MTDALPLTTTQVAKLCHVSTGMVQRWIDAGHLRAYRIPGSRHRRVPRQYLIEFMREHGIPMGELTEETHPKDKQD